MVNHTPRARYTEAGIRIDTLQDRAYDLLAKAIGKGYNVLGEVCSVDPPKGNTDPQEGVESVAQSMTHGEGIMSIAVAIGASGVVMGTELFSLAKEKVTALDPGKAVREMLDGIGTIY